MVRSGELKHFVDIQAPTRVSDGMFGFTETFTTLESNVPVAIWPISASETLKGGRMENTITHRVKMRWRANMRTNFRLKFKDRYFNIVSIINKEERNRELDILCREAA